MLPRTSRVLKCSSHILSVSNHIHNLMADLMPEGNVGKAPVEKEKATDVNIKLITPR